MEAYKAFDIGLKCRGYQFVVGLNVTDQANCVRNGFHCAENPIDCLSYYPYANRSVFCLVDAGGDIDEDARDSKIACTELTIKKILSLETYLLHCLMWLVKHPSDVVHSKIHKDSAEAANGYCIVYGKSPVAKGEEGDVLALLQTDAKGDGIALSVLCVGRNGIEPGVYYDVFGTERKYV